MSIPVEVRARVERRVGPFRVSGAVGGGCIHPSFRIRTREGEVFLKYGRRTGPDFFAVEAEGLRQLARAASGLCVPTVVGHEDAADGQPYGWLALEWLEPGRRGPSFPLRLAEGLTRLHAARAEGWGWERNGYIGTLLQENGGEGRWATFWRRRRLQPQLARARQAGRAPASEREWAVLFERLPEVLGPAEEDGPSLIHGDLWGGNILATAAGEPAIVDPAAYRGHREVDLAMSELFGGFDASFYEAYAERRPLQPGYREWRRGVYQLYYLLVHVNLFGDGYVAPTAAKLRSVLAAL